MLTVATVLRSGGDFKPEHVHRLYRQVEEHLTVPYKFVCLTDTKPSALIRRHDVYIEFLEHDWPGWWAKLELFRIDGPVLYFDLDMTIVGNIDKLAQAVIDLEENQLMVGKGFLPTCCDVQSWCLGWSVGMPALWELAQVHSVVPGGDQWWLKYCYKKAGLELVYAQDFQPGMYSYKFQLERGKLKPDDLSVIIFHGKPRPWDDHVPTSG